MSKSLIMSALAAFAISTGCALAEDSHSMAGGHGAAMQGSDSATGEVRKVDKDTARLRSSTGSLRTSICRR